MQKIILATNSAKHFGFDNGQTEIGRFPDGEVSVFLKDNVKDREVFIIGSTEPPAENLMELTFLISKVYADGAKKVTAVVPYLGYSRGDREAKLGEVATAPAVSKMIRAVAGENFEVVLVDPHSAKVPGFFSCPVKEVSMIEALSKRFAGINGLCIVAPDGGATARAEKFAEILGNKNIVRIEKKRISPEKVEVGGIAGSVGENALIVDDMVQTGGTILEVTKALKENGANEIFVAATHMVYSAGGYLKLAESNLISGIVTTDTINAPEDLPSKFEIVSIAPVLTELFS